MTPRLTAPAVWAVCLLLGGSGCAQSVSTTDDTTGTSTTTNNGGTGGTGGTGGSGGGTTTTSVTVPEDCTDTSECAGLNSACSEGECVSGKCVANAINDFSSCDDGNLCTDSNQCNDGKCVGIPKSCGIAPACKVASCNPATGLCEEKPGDDGAQCEDGDPCTYFGTCDGGVCQKGEEVDCSFLTSQCTVGKCDPALGCQAQPANEGNGCEDGQFCTSKDVCQSGVCVGGVPTACAPPGGCFVGMCDENNNTCTAVPGNDGAACDDGSPCTASTTCSSGACINGTPANDGMACDDGTSCTLGETCSAGTCGGGTGPEVFFADDFADNSAGWVLGPEWQIAPAKQGFTNGFGFPDPENDHTATADDGVAGVVIGGDASVGPHGYYYLESPTFNTSAAAGKVILGYYRWLNSDGTPYMHNRVEVWNGNAWITVWAKGDFFFETSWTFVQHDITNYKNPAMRVRFGFDMGEFGFSSFSSWNIDDVLVASQACP